MGSKFDRIKDYITGFKAERLRLTDNNADLAGQVIGLKAEIESLGTKLDATEKSAEELLISRDKKIAERDAQLDELLALIEDLDEPQQPESEEESADRIRQEEEVGEAMYEKGVVSLTPPTMKKEAAKKTKKGK